MEHEYSYSFRWCDAGKGLWYAAWPWGWQIKTRLQSIQQVCNGGVWRTAMGYGFRDKGKRFRIAVSEYDPVEDCGPFGV